MPSPKTEATELSVAFGLLGLDPLDTDEASLPDLFEETLALDKFRQFKQNILNDRPYYERLISIGRTIRQCYGPFSGLRSLKWEGPEQQANTTTGAKDLLAARIPVSVKADSDVVLNPSPYNLFECIPLGLAIAQDTQNWYAEVAPSEFQELYASVRRASGQGSATVDEFETSATRGDRKRVQSAIESMDTRIRAQFDSLYKHMCRRVALESAVRFNTNLARSLRGQSRNSVLEVIGRNFFRLNGSTYILCGSDHGCELGVEIPDLTSWKKVWRIRDVCATPDLERLQSVVNFEVIYEQRETGRVHRALYHSEIRWSHGKFCGSPEAKLYKEFRWLEVPFFNRVI